MVLTVLSFLPLLVSVLGSIRMSASTRLARATIAGSGSSSFAATSGSSVFVLLLPRQPRMGMPPPRVVRFPGRWIAWRSSSGDILEIGIEPIASGQVLQARPGGHRAGRAVSGAGSCRPPRRNRLCLFDRRSPWLSPWPSHSLPAYFLLGSGMLSQTTIGVNRVERLPLKPVHHLRMPSNDLFRTIFWSSARASSSASSGPARRRSDRRHCVLERVVHLVWNGSGFQQVGAVQQVRGVPCHCPCCSRWWRSFRCE